MSDLQHTAFFFFAHTLLSGTRKITSHYWLNSLTWDTMSLENALLFEVLKCCNDVGATRLKKKKNPNDTLKQILKTKDQTLPPSVIVFFCHPPPAHPPPSFFLFCFLFVCLSFKWASARSTPFASGRWQRQQSVIQAKVNATSTQSCPT